MKSDKTADIIIDFCEEYYPKEHPDRGYALVVLALFLYNWLPKSKEYHLIRNAKLKKNASIRSRK